MRLLTTHLLLSARSAIDAATALAPPPPAGATQAEVIHTLTYTP